MIYACAMQTVQVFIAGSLDATKLQMLKQGVTGNCLPL